MKSNKTLCFGRTKSFLLFCLMCFCFCVQSALAVDWGTSTAYRSQITQGGVQGNFYYLDRADGGVTITGIQLDSQPTAGDVVYIPETLDGKPVYGIYRCGAFEYFTLVGDENKYYTEALVWENAPTSLVLSLPGTLKEVAPKVVMAASKGAKDGEIANSALTELIIRESSTTPTMRIEDKAFDELPNLTKVTLGKGVKSIGKYAFNEAPITTISAFPDGLEVVEGYAFAKILVEQDLYLPSTLTILGDYAFGDARQGKGWFFHNQLTIPAGMKFLGHYVFCGSRKVGMSVELPEGLETIRTFVFVNTFIKEITIPSTVVEIHNSAFRGMVMLEKVKFKANKVLQTLGVSLFMNNPNLRYIDMSEVENPALTMTGLSRSARGVFNGVYPYTIVYLPKSVTADGVVADGQENFVQYQNGTWICKNFVAYDSHSAYLPANINHDATVFATTNVHYAPNKMTAEEQKAFTDWKASLIAGRGCDYDMPMGFTATSAVYKRAFATTPAVNALMTVSLPYNTTTAQAGLKLFKLVSEKELNGSYNNKGEYFLSLDDSRLNQSSLTTEEQAQCATANHAYVVKVADATGLGSADAKNYYSLFASTNATVLATPQTYTVTVADDNKSTWSFAGHPMNISNADAAAAKFYVLNGSTKTWHPIKATNVNGFVHSFRGALQYTGSSTSYAQAFPKIVGADEALDTTTGINAVETSATSDTAVYSLDGRKVGTSLTTLPAGVYVVGGQKVVK